METAMTLSRLADWIIVISFFSLCGAGLGCIISELIMMIIDSIRKALKRRRERRNKAAEEQSAE